ncbi:hypothetical protein ASAC_0893 [Acidilobus saccharovorans 345-15]|uniref:Uncharacterized protein n=1 Tax=Acidilobus saccharovorans (strain DSM 16705 / JCM 18335 / VKM B-2471 / 345-15) TaxID=666510 RepID=D9Q1W1_ACIS3|nr:hypothetical protein [Acidilobus saccharovorans]ADL19299.1 hypothetical protein ASAC_0893 [Acidilobus saccharovorans 345-15]
MARSRRSISDIVAVVMLIIIAIAAAVLIYAWLSGLVGGVHTSNAGLYTKIEIVGGSITSTSTSGQYTVSATVENIGGTAATINYMAVENVTTSSVICSTSSSTSTSSFSPTTIPPGKSVTLSFTCSLSSSTPAPASGTAVEIVASTSDGVTATYITTWP